VNLMPAKGVLGVARLLMAARGSRQQGDIDAAEAAYEDILQARPHLVSLELELAAMRLEHGRLDAAVRQLRQRLSFAQIGSDEERLQLEALLLEALLRQERWVEAEPLLRALWSRGQAKPHHLLALARGLEGIGQDDQALAVLGTALEEDDLDPEARLELQLELARRLRKLGRLQKAIETMGLAVLLAPERLPLAMELSEIRAQALTERGEEALAREDWTGARRAFRSLLELCPNDTIAPQRLELLQSLDPASLQPRQPSSELDLDDQLRWRQDAAERLDQFSRLLDRLEEAAAPEGAQPAEPPAP
jgi:tetratricopeptide (TPR) repeat protein